jgi:hypothetical protein
MKYIAWKNTEFLNVTKKAARKAGLQKVNNKVCSTGSL